MIFLIISKLRFHNRKIRRCVGRDYDPLISSRVFSGEIKVVFLLAWKSGIFKSIQ